MSMKHDTHSHTKRKTENLLVKKGEFIIDKYSSSFLIAIIVCFQYLMNLCFIHGFMYRSLFMYKYNIENRINILNNAYKSEWFNWQAGLCLSFSSSTQRLRVEKGHSLRFVCCIQFNLLTIYELDYSRKRYRTQKKNEPNKMSVNNNNHHQFCSNWIVHFELLKVFSRKCAKHVQSIKYQSKTLRATQPFPVDRHIIVDIVTQPNIFFFLLVASKNRVYSATQFPRKNPFSMENWKLRFGHLSFRVEHE